MALSFSKSARIKSGRPGRRTTLSSLRASVKVRNGEKSTLVVVDAPQLAVGGLRLHRPARIKSQGRKCILKGKEEGGNEVGIAVNVSARAAAVTQDQIDDDDDDGDDGDDGTVLAAVVVGGA